MDGKTDRHTELELKIINLVWAHNVLFGEHWKA